MQLLRVFLICGCGLGVTFFASGKELESGLQEGEKFLPFYVHDVTGPRSGKAMCYACAFGQRHVVNIQTRSITADVLKLIKHVDRKVSSPGKLESESKHAFVVYLHSDANAAKKELRRVARELELKNCPLTISEEAEGPAHYKLSADAALTIMMWSDRKITKNIAFRSANINKKDMDKLLTAVDMHLEKK